MSENNNNRIDYVDLFRGIGIILMVFGHMKFRFAEGGFGDGIYDHYYHLIHAFHMPMFFFLSGYCFRRSDIRAGKYILKKARSLLLPYIAFGIGEYALWRVFQGDSFTPLLHLFWTNTEGLAIAGALWFLTALFIAVILYFLLDRYLNNIYILSFVCMIVAIIGCMLPGLMSYRLPFATDAAMVGIGFIHIGRMIRQESDKRFIMLIQNMKIWQALLLAIPNIVLIMYNGTINMRIGRYDNILLFWINAIVAIIIGINLCKSVKCIGLLDKEIRNIGRNGIIYVCVNELVITILARILNKFIESTTIYNICLVVLVFVAIRMTSEIMVKLLGHEFKRNANSRD